MFHVKSHIFLLLVSSRVIVAIATVSAIVVGGCRCCYCRRELTLLQEGTCVMPTNRIEEKACVMPNNKTRILEQVLKFSCPSLFLPLFFSHEALE